MSKSITIRHVPDDVRDELASRASQAGQSLQEYLRSQLVELARKPAVTSLLARARQRKERTASRLPADRILAHRNAERP